MEQGQAGSAVYLLFRDGDAVLFVKRDKTGYMDGMHCLPASKVEPSEQYTVAAVRAGVKTVGLEVSPDNISFLYLQHRYSEDGNVWTDIFFDAGEWQGEPSNTEPGKHSELAWFYTDDLPDTIISYQKTALERIAEGKLYGEIGWLGDAL